MIISEIYSRQAGPGHPIPLFSEPVEAGFPSPADDYIDCTIDLNEQNSSTRTRPPPSRFACAATPCCTKASS